MHRKKIINAGKKLSEAKKVLILLHGRGGSADDVLSLAAHLHVNGFALLAPQASNYSWYPQSFLAPPAENEPWLSSALQIVNETLQEAEHHGISKEHIYFTGFSQGACLMLEFVARNAARYGGIAAFTGGLIGDKIYTENYKGDFAGTPVFIGSSNPDAHVPVERVRATTGILKQMKATVTEIIYDKMGHTISKDEIEKVNELIFNNA